MTVDSDIHLMANMEEVTRLCSPKFRLISILPVFVIFLICHAQFSARIIEESTVEITELKSKLSEYKEYEASNLELLKINNSLKRKVAELEKRKPVNDEVYKLEEIQVMAQNSTSGHRRDTPTAPPRPAPVPSQPTPQQQHNQPRSRLENDKR